MPPKRRRVVATRTNTPRKAAGSSSSSAATAGRATRGRRKETEPDVPEVFREMLAEEEAKERAARKEQEKPGKRTEKGHEEDRAAKRRRKAEADGQGGLGARTVLVPKVEADDVGGDDDDDDDDDADEDGEDDDGDDSDVDWEDVDLSSKPVGLRDIMNSQSLPESEQEPRSTVLNLVLKDPSPSKPVDVTARRKITAVDRRIRLETHKLHLLCLLFHVHLRNRWCNIDEVQKNLRPLLPDKVYAKLHHDPTDQQFRRSKMLIDGLKEAAAAFRKKFTITRRGLTAAQWMEAEALKKWSTPLGTELVSKADFIRASTTLTGSRDLGAQLFCALLRSAGIEARLVCSLQVLPFTFKQKAPAARMTAPPAATPKPENSPTASPRRTGTLAHPIVRAPYVVPPTPSAPRPKPAPIDHVASDYPVFWIEAWSVPAQRWITVDILVTHTVATPTALEPPLSDPRNTLSYVLAFEGDSHATDVTRRYAAYLLARTRRSRVHSTKGGDSWFRRILRRNFHRGYTEDRDQLEAAEFAKLSLDEPMPKAVQDFKDHPVFALKRHLRRDQIISPERKVGTVQSGKGRTETVFRRQDVKEVKTVEQWYKLGREVLENEIPLKFTAPRTRARRGDDGRGEEEDEALPYQPMFALAQTKLYTPPPVVNGIVPKNRFGNLDVFVPSMVPAGGVHIPHKTARNAARILGIDFVDVVTGFEFRNRIASPLIKGVVVASEYGEAVEAVVEGLEWEAEMEAERQRGLEALRLWGRWLLRLRIRERLGVGSDEVPVARFTTDGAGARGERPGAKRRSKRRVQSEEEEEDEEEGGEEGEDEDEDEEGGFLADTDDEEFVRRRSRMTRRVAVDGGGEAEGVAVGDCGGGGFLADEDGDGGGGSGSVSVGDGSGGGFLPDDGHGCGSVPVEGGHGCGGGGGFLPEGDAANAPPTAKPDPTDRCSAAAEPDDGGGGGFLPATPSAAHEEEETGGGGFLPGAEADACVSRSLGEEEDDDDEEPDWDLLGL